MHLSEASEWFHQQCVDLVKEILAADPAVCMSVDEKSGGDMEVSFTISGTIKKSDALHAVEEVLKESQSVTQGFVNPDVLPS